VGCCLLGFKVRVFARVLFGVCGWDSYVCVKALRAFSVYLEAHCAF
jgi:hypothetical protein